MRQKTFEYAANFEEFIKIINSTTDTEELKRYRNHIVNEIMEVCFEFIVTRLKIYCSLLLKATAMQNQQRSKGLDPDSEKANTCQSKSDLYAAKKLKQYVFFIYPYI